MTKSRGESGRPICMDAVIVVPGMLGSELVDRDGDVCWGLSAAMMGEAWITHQLEVLHVNEDDLAGKRVNGKLRLRPKRLLRVPGYLPFLRGIEPYTRLVREVKATVVDSRAVAEFPYDWRLSIEYNASELVRCCDSHLTTWRRIVATERYCDPKDVRLVLVAHSMGGLIARIASAAPGMPDALRELITLGTPYFGAVKAIRMLETGEGAPAPEDAARQLACTCPGVYDLLPRYRCVRDYTDPGRMRHLSLSDIDSIGGNRDLAEDAAMRWKRFGLAGRQLGPETKAVVGADQPTLQSVSFVAGVGLYMNSIDGTNYGGDSTVYRRSAAPIGVTASPLPQKHGALAKSSEALIYVVDKLTGADTPPPLGTFLGADIPDLVDAASALTVRVTGAHGDPVGISVRNVELATNAPTTWRDVRRDDDDLLYSRNGLPPGLHRIEVDGGGFSAVSDITLVTEPQ